jgi:hypothetical protein
MKNLNISRNSPGNEDNHYGGAVQPIDFIELWNLPFVEGCIVKYISRHRKKGKAEDVKKVIWYLGVLKQRLKDGRFKLLDVEGSITIAEYVEAQELGVNEKEVFGCLMHFLIKGNEFYLDASLAAAVELLRWYEHTDEDVDEAFGSDVEKDEGVIGILEDQIYERMPSPWGKPHPTRYHLDDERRGKTVRFQMGGKNGYFTVNTYSDGSPGEVFIDELGKEGEEVHGWADMWAIAVSMLLQFGVDPQKIYAKFQFQQFEPAGPTGVKSVPLAKSAVDLIAKWMEKNLEPTRKPEFSADGYDAAIELVAEGGE